MTTIDRGQIIARFGGALASVVGALVGRDASAQLSAVPPEPGFTVAIEAAEGGRGTLIATFDGAGARAVSMRITGRSDEPSDAAVADSLREICTQVAATFADGGASPALHLRVVSARPATDPVDAASATLVEVSVEGDQSPLRVALSGTLEFSGRAPVADSHIVEISPGLEVILDMDLPVVVRFGRTELPLKTLAALGPGSVIELARSPDDPVDILVSNQVVATGEVVIVNGNYGVRIRDVISPADRMRTMEVEAR
jgi:flagellar motor switch protein FliN